MASGTILLGFYAAFCSLDLLEQATVQTQQQSGLLARLAATAFAPAVVLTFALTVLLLGAHVRALDAVGAGAGRGPFLGRLRMATVLAAVAALTAASVLRLHAGGYLGVIGGGADDIGWLDVK